MRCWKMGANGCWRQNCVIFGVLRSSAEGGAGPDGRPRLLDIEPLLALSTDREMKIRGQGLSLGGTELKFVTGPGPAHEHGENRA